jgi:hypothetical protein
MGEGHPCLEGEKKRIMSLVALEEHCSGVRRVLVGDEGRCT